MTFCIFLLQIGHLLGFSVELESILKAFNSCLVFSCSPSSSSSSPASSQMPPQSMQWSISTSASSRVIIALLQTGQSIAQNARNLTQQPTNQYCSELLLPIKTADYIKNSIKRAKLPFFLLKAAPHIIAICYICRGDRSRTALSI